MFNLDGVYGIWNTSGCMVQLAVLTLLFSFNQSSVQNQVFLATPCIILSVLLKKIITVHIQEHYVCARASVRLCSFWATWRIFVKLGMDVVLLEDPPPPTQSNARMHVLCWVSVRSVIFFLFQNLFGPFLVSQIRHLCGLSRTSKSFWVCRRVSKWDTVWGKGENCVSGNSTRKFTGV